MVRTATLMGLLLAAASLAESLQADGVVIDKIYHPYVQPGEKEIEGRAIWQNRQPGRPDDLQLYRLGYGQSVGDTWFLELYALGKNSDAESFGVAGYEFEALTQLTEQGQYWADLGLLFELEREADLDAWEFSAGLLVEKEWGRWSGTANLFLLQEWGSDVVDETETRLGLQTRYRLSPAFEPAVEFYSGEDTRGIGPVVMGEFDLGADYRAHWETGVIFGVDSKSPDATVRLLFEFEF